MVHTSRKKTPHNNIDPPQIGNYESAFSADVFSQPLIDKISDPIKDAVATAILNQKDIYNYTMAAAYNRFTFKASAYLRYGETRFINRLPTSEMVNTSVDEAALKTVLAGIEGESVTLITASISPPNDFYVAMDHLQNHTNATWIPGNLSGPGAFPKEKIFFKFPGDSIFWYLSDVYHPSGIGQPSNKLVIELTDSFADPDGFRATKEITLSNPEYDENYYQVIYHADTKPASYTHYWSHHITIATDPSLVPPPGEQFSEYYPIVPIRINRDFVNKDKKSEIYKSSRAILKKLKLDIDFLIENIEADPEDKPNEDLDKLDDVYVMFAVDLYTTQIESLHYLYDFLVNLKARSGTSKAAFEAAQANIQTTGAPVPQSEYNVYEDEFNLKVFWNYIDVEILNESINEDYAIQIKKQDHNVIKADNGSYIVTRMSEVRIRKRLNESQVSMITWHGPKHVTRVQALGYYEYVQRYPDPKYLDPPDDEKGTAGFYLPLSYRVLDEMPRISHREIVLYDSLTMVMYAADLQHLKWYQSGWFGALLSFVLNLIAVALFVYMLPAGAAFSFILMEILVSVAISFTISFIIELILENVDGTLGYILAAIAAVAVIMTGSKISNNKLPFADQLMKAVTSSINTVAQIDTQLKMDLLQQEYETWEIDAEEREEELDKASDLLDNEFNIDPLYVTETLDMLSPQMSSEQYYDLSIHETNPGVLSLNAIKEYVDNMLRLPEPDDLALSETLRA